MWDSLACRLTVLARNHDAVTRIEGLAPERRAHSSDRHLGHGFLLGCHHPIPDLHGRIRGHPDPTDECRSSRFAISLRVPVGA